MMVEGRESQGLINVEKEYHEVQRLLQNIEASKVGNFLNSAFKKYSLSRPELIIGILSPDPMELKEYSDTHSPQSPFTSLSQKRYLSLFEDEESSVITGLKFVTGKVKDLRSREVLSESSLFLGAQVNLDNSIRIFSAVGSSSKSGKEVHEEEAIIFPLERWNKEKEHEDDQTIVEAALERLFVIAESEGSITKPPMLE